MNSTVEKLPENQVKIDIEVPAKDAVNYYNNAIRMFSQHANIPGFRKGKAPRTIVERHYGVDAIKHQALENALPDIFGNIIAENKLDLVTQPQVEDYTFNVGEDLKISAKAELKPEVTLGEYKNLTLEVEGHKNEDGLLQKEVDNLLKQHSTFNIITDRKTVATDTVVFDFEGFANDEKIEHGEGKNYSLDLSNSNFIPGFAEQLVGHDLGEEFDISVTFPEEYHAKELAGKPATFKCKINEIKEAVLPELNDEFAKKIGKFENVDELKADIERHINDEKERIDKTSSEKAVVEKVIADSKMDIQKSMIERETEHLLDEYKQGLAYQGFTWEQSVEHNGYDKIMADLRSDAEERIKRSLVFGEIAKQEDIKVSQTDIMSDVMNMAAMYGMDYKEMMSNLYKTPGSFNAISQRALSSKVIEFLMKNNTVNIK